MLDSVLQDVRYAFRSLRRTPAFAATAIVTLALGIGANTAIFSVLNSVLLRPLAYARSEQLIQISSRYQQYPGIAASLSVPEYQEFRRMGRSFADVGAFTTGEVNITAGDRPLRVKSARVDDHLLAVLGVHPASGRFFTTEEIAVENGVGGAPVAILSYELWHSLFGGALVVGEKVPIEGRPYQVIGVMPPGVDLMDNHTEVWLPLGLPPTVDRQRDSHLIDALGRLKEGTTLEAARTELTALVANWGARAGTQGHVPTDHRLNDSDHTLYLEQLHDAIVGDNARRAIWVLQIAVGFVLIIACANVAILMTARAEPRRREFAMRAALGATRARLVRQGITEGLLLGFAGGALGLWVAVASVRALLRAYPASLPRTSDVAIDVPVLLFALAISTITGIVFGLVPAGHRWVNGLATALKQGADRGSAGLGRHGMRRILVAGEVALAVMLVLGASLLTRTVYNLTHADAGFDRSRLATFTMTLPLATSEPDTRARSYTRLLEALRDTPAIEAATAVSGLPFQYENSSQETPIENYTSPTGEAWEIALNQLVMSDYFETMRIPIVEGRSFDRTDIASRRKVVVVNETFARNVWKGRSPLGNRVRPLVYGVGQFSWHTVIGVAKDVSQMSINGRTLPELYIFAEEEQAAPATMHVIVRTQLSPGALTGTLQRLVKDVDPVVPISQLREMSDVFADSIGRPRLLAQLLGAFAALGLLLAAVGTYGLLSYVVAQRRREIGVRMALGAARSTVMVLILKQGSLLIAGGIILGLAGAVAGRQLIAALLFGVEPNDASTIAAVVTTIAVVASVACGLPAWRASRVDPAITLRAE